MSDDRPGPPEPVPRGPGASPPADGEPSARVTVEQPAPGSAPGPPWRRLSPRMLLVHPVREVIRFFPVLIGLLIAGSTGDGQRQWWSLAGTGVAVLLGLLRWFTTSYRFDEAQVQLRHGLLNKQTLTAPMDRIRSVDVTATVLHRALGLALVRIGTGAGESELKLDGLGAGAAARLREDLLHRHGAGRGVGDAGEPAGGTGTVPAASVRPDEQVAGPAAGSTERVLYRLRGSWLRYAPFNPAGLVTTLVVLAGGMQVLNEAGVFDPSNRTLEGALSSVQRWSVVTLVVVLVALVIGLILVLSLGGYVLSYWGFRLTSDRSGGSLLASRGLLTTRATSLELRRLRGVELREPVPLRWVGGANLHAVTTGIRAREQHRTAVLAPPSPAGLVRELAGEVLDEPGLLAVPLRRHGHSATRRRYSRALVPAGLVALALVVLGLTVAPAGVAVLAVLPLAGGLALGRARARDLGHAVTTRHLVTRVGGLSRRTSVIDRDGVVAISIRTSFFQRRAGVGALPAPPAAGSQGYEVLDLASEDPARPAAGSDPVDPQGRSVAADSDLVDPRGRLVGADSDSVDPRGRLGAESDSVESVIEVAEQVLPGYLTQFHAP